MILHDTNSNRNALLVILVYKNINTGLRLHVQVQPEQMILYRVHHLSPPTYINIV